jgi:uncharacterized membrane protein YphA (DoxX/SURF4 family)
MIEERARNTALLVGRVLLAGCFAPVAFSHAANISGLAASLGQKGMPYADAVTALIVLTEIFCPLALLLGVAPRLAPAALFASTLLVNGALHRFWEFGGAARHVEQTIFTAQLGVLAALLFACVAGPAGWSLHAWLKGGDKPSRHAAKKKAARAKPSKPKLAASRPARDDEELADAA